MVRGILFVIATSHKTVNTLVMKVGMSFVEKQPGSTIPSYLKMLLAKYLMGIQEQT